MTRRKFLQMTTAATVAVMKTSFPVCAGEPEDERILVPADKGFGQDWVRNLFLRGEPEVFSGEQSKYIGMPVGGLCAGLLYLGGDGKPWLWDIFNRNSMGKSATYEGRTLTNTDGSTYVEPLIPRSPLAHGFAVKHQTAGKSATRTLDKDGGWTELTFQGDYPLATINYADPEWPLAVKLEAFSPFIPLNFDDSSYPATIMRYTVTNTANTPAEVEVAGWLENVVLAMSSPGEAVSRQNRPIKDECGQGILLSGDIVSAASATAPDINFADFSDGTYDGWTAVGTAFGSRPVARKDLPAYMHDLGGEGEYLVTSQNFRITTSAESADDLQGTLTSRPFTIERSYIVFFSSGGHRPHEAGVRLIVGGKPVLETTGDNENRLTQRVWSVNKYKGQQAQIEIFDHAIGLWGHVHASNFLLTDKPISPVAVKQRHDFGTMAIYLVDTGPGISSYLALSEGRPEEQVFAASTTIAPSDRPVAALKKAFTLAPGQSRTLNFVLSWHFANVDPRVNGLGTTHSYAARFPDADAVAQHIAANFERLRNDTFTWVQTWHDSTLPHWFLNRTFNNICILATTTSYRFANGQFWAWEGVYSCEGTCTHVWGYAQAMARIFPELERALREKTDYGFALDPKTGTINFRGTHGGFAADGQAGIILRTYREHLMTVDDSFLKPLWPKVRLAMDRLISQVNDKGLLDGPQHNTLDTAWFGEVSWISGLYLAALRAAEEMAKVTGDSDYGGKCRSLFAKGSQSLVPELFNGEYFANKIDPRHLDAINSGTGCEIDQLMGQSWSWQVGLGRIFPQKESVTALKALYRYNFAPDAGHYHEQMKVGRWYAMPGEAGLLVCTFPKPDWDFKKASGKGPAWAAQYFNECQSGYEYEAASNMIAEGLVQEGLAVVCAIHDRYAPEKRNPFNEIECGDHYSRAMASYGSFITACGFEYNGPDGYIGFAPRLTPHQFKAAFTSARGWGSFAQRFDGAIFTASLALKWGELMLRKLSVEPSGATFNRLVAKLDGQPVPATFEKVADRVHILFGQNLTLTAHQTLNVSLF